MKKEEMERLWGDLSGGVEGIYQRYARARSLRKQEHEAQKDEAKRQYEKEQNQINAAAGARQREVKATLADHGLGRSGESLHAELMNNYTHSQASEEAFDRYADTARQLALEQSKADAQSESEMAKEMGELMKALYGFGLEEKKLQQDKELSLRELEQRGEESRRELEQREKESLRETGLKESQFREELAQDQSQWEQENALERDKLEEEKRRFDKEQEILSQEERAKYEEEIRKLSEKKEKGLVPDKSAQSLYEEILYTAQVQYASLAGSNYAEYQAKMREFVTAKLNRLISDEQLDEEYRKSLAVYGMLGGYLG